MTYEEFLERKSMVDAPTGIGDDVDLPTALFDFQRDVTRWALRRGRAAIFAGTGLGKSLMELSWAHAVMQHTGGPAIILAPLAVAAQLVREGAKFGIPAKHCLTSSDVNPKCITVTNYQRIHLFDTDDFAAVVLDESSILKAVDGSTRTMLIERFARTPFRLAATATPAPNDYMELGNHAEFLGVLTHAEMLATFFVHDGGETQKWRLKGHAQSDFWRWLCSWAVMMTNPSDLGYDGEAYNLPPLVKQNHKVTAENVHAAGTMFAMPAVTMQERLSARRATVDDRVSKAVEVVNSEPREQWLVWCNLNDESSKLARAIDGAVEVKGSDSDDHKESALLGFSEGRVRVLVTKPSIAGMGLNFQSCANMIFVGLNDSWEQIYQATRRCWRFGQTRQVNVHFVSADIEGNVVANLERKERQAAAMVSAMVAHTSDLCSVNIKSTRRTATNYSPTVQMEVPQWL